MIHRAKFQNFKALRDVEVTFDSRLTVLVGPNGSGKTSVLQGINLLLQLGTGESFVAAVNRLGLLSLQLPREDTVSLEVRGTLPSGSGEIGLRLELRERDISLGQGIQNEDPQIQYFSDATQGRWVDLTPANRPQLVGASFAQFDPKLLAEPFSPIDGVPHLFPRGHGLASALARIKNNQPEVFNKITSDLASIVKGVKNVEIHQFGRDVPERELMQPMAPPLDQRQTRKVFTESLLFDFGTARRIHAWEVSDGTLLVLGLLTLIHCYPQSAVVLCDDLDHGLHPKAQMDFVHLLRRLLSELPSLQIIATSHSPYILDRLEPREVRVMTLRDDGTAVCAPLASHPDFERWKEAMSPGEFWSTFYEDWLTRKPEPQPAR